MFHLISLGISEHDITQAALEQARSCDSLYLETYTNLIPHTTQSLETLFGKPVTPLSRSALEERSQKLLNEAKENTVGVLVSGDCLTATTHLSLLQSCREQSIPYTITHGPGVMNYILNTGLHYYKFGKTVTLMNPVPSSVFETIKCNKQIGAHTLVLFNTEPPLEIPQALALLAPVAEKVVVCHSLGLPEETVWYGSPKTFQQKAATPACIVIPGPLHFTEEEWLKQFT